MPGDLNTVERVWQAEKFVSMFARIGGNLDQRFTSWADGKDFHPDDRAVIWELVDSAITHARKDRA